MGVKLERNVKTCTGRSARTCGVRADSGSVAGRREGPRHGRSMNPGPAMGFGFGGYYVGSMSSEGDAGAGGMKSRGSRLIPADRPARPRRDRDTHLHRSSRRGRGRAPASGSPRRRRVPRPLFPREGREGEGGPHSHQPSRLDHRVHRGGRRRGVDHPVPPQAAPEGCWAADDLLVQGVPVEDVQYLTGQPRLGPCPPARPPRHRGEDFGLEPGSGDLPSTTRA